MVGLLLQKGADVAFGKSLTALDLAVTGGHVDVLNMRLRYGADTNNNFSFSLLICAVQNDYIDIVQVLLDHGVDIQVRGSKDRTPLMYADIKFDRDIALLLLEYGADITGTIWEIECKKRFS